MTRRAHHKFFKTKEIIEEKNKNKSYNKTLLRTTVWFARKREVNYSAVAVQLINIASTEICSVRVLLVNHNAKTDLGKPNFVSVLLQSAVAISFLVLLAAMIYVLGNSSGHTG